VTDINGIVAYPITPYLAGSHDIDTELLCSLVDSLIETGANAIAPLGSAGECAYLTESEWQLVAETTISHVNKRVPVIVGISELTTKDAVNRAIFAEKSGADAVMVILIAYWPLSEEEVFNHYKAIADAISIPIMAYNNPATGGLDMKPEFICRMVNEIDNITMVKESTGDIQRMHRIHEISNGEIPIFCGNNTLALEAFAAGAIGWCTAAPNLIGDLPQQLYSAMQSKDLSTAQAVFYKQLGLLRFIVQGGLAATVKAGLRTKGIEAGAPRKPMLEISSERVAELKSLLVACSS